MYIYNGYTRKRLHRVVDPEKEMRFLHYRSPDGGVHGWKGKDKVLKKDMSIKNQYADRMVATMEEFEYKKKSIE